MVCMTGVVRRFAADLPLVFVDLFLSKRRATVTISKPEQRNAIFHAGHFEFANSLHPDSSISYAGSHNRLV
jgi:hypothetical protein